MAQRRSSEGRTVDLIVDANSVYAKGFYAAYNQREVYENSDGEHVEGVVMAMKIVLSLLNPMSGRLPTTPDRLLFCWDGERKNEKVRKDKPEGYHKQMEIFKDVSEQFLGAAHCVAEGTEGDDGVITAAYRSESAGNVVYIASGDKDLLQAVSENVRYYSINKKRTVNVKTVCEEWKVHRPIHVALALACIGDKSDNIKGVPRVGAVGFAKLYKDAVTPDMNLEEAAEAIASVLGKGKEDPFWESLDQTLLDSDVPGIVDPNPLHLADSSLVLDLGYDALHRDYLAIYCNLNGLDPDDMYDL